MKPSWLLIALLCGSLEFSHFDLKKRKLMSRQIYVESFSKMPLLYFGFPNILFPNAFTVTLITFFTHMVLPTLSPCTILIKL